MAKLSCGGNCLRVLLTVVNIVFLILGLALIAVGCYVRYDTSFFGGKYKDDVEKVFGPHTLGGFDPLKVLKGMSLLFVVVGIFVAVIAALGCCGACCKWKWMLVVYSAMIALLLIAQVVGVTLFFTKLKDRITCQIKKSSRRSFNQYTAPDVKAPSTATEALSRSMDVFFTKFHCCGVTGAEDVTQGEWNNSDLARRWKIPYSCCIDADKLNMTSPDIKQCARHPTIINSYKSVGCYNKVMGFLKTHSTIIVVIGVSIMAFELAAVISALLVFRELRNGYTRI